MGKADLQEAAKKRPGPRKTERRSGLEGKRFGMLQRGTFKLITRVAVGVLVFDLIVLLLEGFHVHGFELTTHALRGLVLLNLAVLAPIGRLVRYLFPVPQVIKGLIKALRKALPPQL